MLNELILPNSLSILTFNSRIRTKSDPAEWWIHVGTHTKDHEVKDCVAMAKNHNGFWQPHHDLRLSTEFTSSSHEDDQGPSIC